MSECELFDAVLLRAPLHSSHWSIEKNKYVRMGRAVVKGYLSLEVMRSVQSRKLVSKLTGSAALLDIKENAPSGAIAYSLSAGCYVFKDKSVYKIHQDEGLVNVVEVKTLTSLLYLHHIQP